MILADFTHADLFTLLDDVRGDIDFAACYLNVAVTYDLARLGTAGSEPHAVDDAIETALHGGEQVFAGDAFGVSGFFERITELRFDEPVNALGFLLFTKLETVAYKLLHFLRLAVLTRNVVALFDGALFGIAAFAFQEQFHALAPA